MDGSDRESVTVLACGMGAGVILRPLVLHDGETISDSDSTTHMISAVIRLDSGPCYVPRIFFKFKFKFFKRKSFHG